MGKVPIARMDCGCQYLVEIEERINIGSLLAACVEHQRQLNMIPVQLTFDYKKVIDESRN